jgi:hypothetical protein
MGDELISKCALCCWPVLIWCLLELLVVVCLASPFKAFKPETIMENVKEFFTLGEFLQFMRISFLKS